MGKKTRAALIIVGLFIPVVLTSVLGHGHSHGEGEIGAPIVTHPSDTSDPSTMLDIMDAMGGDIMEGTKRIL
jgi:hypothetical protein